MAGTKKKSKTAKKTIEKAKKNVTKNATTQRPKIKKKSKDSRNVEEIALHNRRLTAEIDKVRRRNGELFTALQESAPDRLGSQGEVLPLERVKANTERKAQEASTGMRASAEPCAECDRSWEETSRRGRMNKVCPECREDDTVEYEYV